MTRTILVRAAWDFEAKVYTATSEDVPGLVAEAANLEALEIRLQTLIPELLDLNADLLPERPNAREDWADVPLVVVSRQGSKFPIHA